MSRPSPRFPKAQLLSLISFASGVQTVWNTDARGQLGQQTGTEKAWVVIGVQSLGNVAVDELRQQFDPVGQTNLEIVAAHRSFTLTVSARSLDATLEAYDLLERVRFGLRTADARAMMVPNISLRDIQPIRTFPDAADNGRIILSASMDVRMTCVLAQDPQNVGGGDWIATSDGPLNDTLTP